MRRQHMDQENPGKSIKVGDAVLDAIKSGKAKMRPRWRFAVETWLMAVTGVIVFLILVYLIGFIDFGFYESGLSALPDFGFAGWYSLVWSLPWALISLSIVFLVLLAALFRYHPSTYQWPLVYSFLGVLFLILGGGMVVAQPWLSRAIFYEGPYARLPFVGELYRGFGVPELDNVSHDAILATTTGGFVVQNVYTGRTSTVIVSSNTSFPTGNSFTIGELVIVFGIRSSSGTIDAAGVERSD